MTPLSGIFNTESEGLLGGRLFNRLEMSGPVTLFQRLRIRGHGNDIVGGLCYSSDESPPSTMDNKMDSELEASCTSCFPTRYVVERNTDEAIIKR